jgi:hypothetical protein
VLTILGVEANVSTVSLQRGGPTLSHAERGGRFGQVVVLLPGPTDSWLSYGPVAAERIAAIIRGASGGPEYDGRGMCYLEYGHNEVARVDVAFVSGQRPTGTFEPPSVALAAEKEEFGKTRIRRWFGREWATVAH